MADEKETWVEIDLDSAQEQDRAAKAKATPQAKQTAEVEIEDAPPAGQENTQSNQELDGIETEGAKKRIQKLVAQRKAKEAELATERAEKARLAAELDALKKAGMQSAKADASVYAEQQQAQVKLLEEKYARALEAGDSKTAAETMSDLIRANTTLASTQRAVKEVADEDRGGQLEGSSRQTETRQRQQAAYHPKTQAFIDKHEDWWGKDRVTTAAAVAIAKELESEGFTPEEDDYYSEVESRLKKEFPQKFGQQERQRPRQTVSGASRTPAGAGNRVRLSQDEVNMAKRLGVTVEQYAVQKRRLDGANSGYTTIVD
jgi:hypothetical protein